jgi:hypothetical protein
MKVLSILLPCLLLAGACQARSKPPPKSEFNAEQQVSLKVVALKHASALDLARALSNVRPGTRLIADERTNSVVLAYSTQADLDELMLAIAQLDIEIRAAK